MQPKPPAGLPGKARETLAKILDHVWREECSLSATTRQYGWNVRGPNLYSLHRLFEEQRRQLDQWLAQVGQLAASVGFGPRESASEIGRAGAATQPTPAAVPPRTMIGDLLARHEEMARRLRQDIARLGDPATAELLTRLVEFHETTAWMLRMVNTGPGSDQPA